MIAKKGAKNVVGIDYSKEAIKIAQESHKRQNLQYSNIDVKLIKEKYDVIVSIGTLEHMDDPLKILKIMKSHLAPNGKIIITSPNWTNPRGYILMTLFLLFNSPITLADLHYQTPIDFQNYANKLKMNLKWRTIDKSWAHGEILIKDFQRRIPNVLRDSKLLNKPTISLQIEKWAEESQIANMNAVLSITKEQDIEDGIIHMINDKDLINQNGKKFLELYLSNQGHASQTLAKILDTL